MSLLCPADVVLNEDCPRYNYRCDFVNVSGGWSWVGRHAVRSTQHDWRPACHHNLFMAHAAFTPPFMPF
jgi:hypothetical protein